MNMKINLLINPIYIQLIHLDFIQKTKPSNNQNTKTIILFIEKYFFSSSNNYLKNQNNIFYIYTILILRKK